MRVAVSGTHCCGKSTLIDEFLLAHPDFTHEPEPYTGLEEDYGEVFAAEPSPDDFYRQLEFNVDRLRCYRPGERVIGNDAVRQVGPEIGSLFVVATCVSHS